MNSKQERKIKVILTVAHDEYAKGLNKRAFFKVNDHMLGEDLVQTTFMKTWSYLVKGGKIDTMKAFLYHILNNLIIDEYRKHKAISLEVLVEKGFEPSVDNSISFINVLDGRALFDMIRFLPKKYQKIISMRYMNDMSLKEISLLTGISKNTITVQVHRGLEKMKTIAEMNKADLKKLK